MGYRAMHQELESVYNLQKYQETVRLCLKTLDPEGVEDTSGQRHRKCRCRHSTLVALINIW